MTVGAFKQENCLLHYILMRALIPKPGNYAQITSKDTLIMWAMTIEHPINWGYHVAQHMAWAKEKGTDLPYAMLITVFLQHFYVPLIGEMTVEESPHYAINENTLSKIGFKKYGDT